MVPAMNQNRASRADRQAMLAAQAGALVFNPDPGQRVPVLLDNAHDAVLGALPAAGAEFFRSELESQVNVQRALTQESTSASIELPGNPQELKDFVASEFWVAW
jgi:hypothetical protein